MPTLLIMAAGMGSRYGGLKQIDPIGPKGETLMDYSIFDAIRAGFERLVFVIRPDIEAAFRENIGSRYEGCIDISYAFQTLDALPAGFTVPEGREKPWGTAQAILVAREVVKEPFAVINADDYYGPGSFKLAANFLNGIARNGKDAAGRDRYAIIGYRLRNTLSEHGHVSRGVCDFDAGGNLSRVIERTKIVKEGAGAIALDAEGASIALTGDEVVSMNFFGFGLSIFDHIDRLFRTFLKEKGSELKSECYIPGVVDALIQEGRASVEIIPTSDQWFGVTYKEDKPLAEICIRERIASGQYPGELLAALKKS